MKKLIVSPFETKEGKSYDCNNLLLINTDKPEYASMMLIESTPTITNGFVNIRKKIGFVTGETKVLKELISEFGLTAGANYNVAIGPHKIITVEHVQSQVPQDSGFRPKINPDTKEELTKNGEVIFWRTYVVPSGSDLEDSFVQHDVDTSNVEATAEAEVEALGNK